MMFEKRLLIGMCSWNNSHLLKSCIISLLPCLDSTKDGIAVVLNESDSESIEFLKGLNIPFVSLPENRGVLAIDYLIPFIQQSEYFLNTNDDMLFAGNFVEDLIGIIDANYPSSASCCLIENFHSNNPCVLVDTELTDIYSLETLIKFQEKYVNYDIGSKTISYCHPICVKSKDYLKIGGYSNNWDLRWFSGYGADDYFAYRLYKLHNFEFRVICSNNSYVFHASSQTMKRLPNKIRNQNGRELFKSETGMAIEHFRDAISLGHKLIPNV